MRSHPEDQCQIERPLRRLKFTKWLSSLRNRQERKERQDNSLMQNESALFDKSENGSGRGFMPLASLAVQYYFPCPKRSMESAVERQPRQLATGSHPSLAGSPHKEVLCQYLITRRIAK